MNRQRKKKRVVNQTLLFSCSFARFPFPVFFSLNVVPVHLSCVIVNSVFVFISLTRRQEQGAKIRKKNSQILCAYRSYSSITSA